MRIAIYHIFIAFFVFFISCSKEETLNLDSQSSIKGEIIVLFSPNRLGDMGYNDLILSGFQKLYKNLTNYNMYLFAPKTNEEAKEIFLEWSETPKEVKSICVLAASNYESILKDCFDNYTLNLANKDILLFESDNQYNLPITTFKVSMYGASYLAGISACSVASGEYLAIGATKQDTSVLLPSLNGFSDGVYDYNNEKVNLEYLSDDFSGYSMSEETYKNMYEWGKKYSFIFPVAGGSNLGIYKFLREFPNSTLTAGMDVDQSYLCNEIVGSVIKKLDEIISFYINMWANEIEIPKKTLFGLESGYVEWRISDNYKSQLNDIINKYITIAIDKEQKYYDNK